MRVLVLGATGMLGHEACRVFAAGGLEVLAAVRSADTDLEALRPVPAANRFGGWQCTDPEATVELLAAARPDAILNAVGIVKQSREVEDAAYAIRVNSLFPHELAKAASEQGARLIQISTDCVFSGRQGGYSESSPPDPVDLYGRSKLLGEVHSRPHLTLRTSMIGREIGTRHGLLEWFLAQAGGSAKGFVHAVFSGLTTTALSRVILELILEHPDLYGVYHLAAKPISKFDLLTLINERMDLGIRITPDEELHCDRSLDGSALERQTGIRSPSWEDMVNGLNQGNT